jgi:hypothetical protein
MPTPRRSIPMAQLNFIKGTIRGKIKTFTKPGNPRTADQVAVRTVFYNVSQIAKAIYEAGQCKA